MKTWHIIAAVSAVAIAGTVTYVVIRRKMKATEEMNAIGGGNAGQAANPTDPATESNPIAGVRPMLVSGEFDRFNIRRRSTDSEVSPQVLSGPQSADTDNNTSAPRGAIGFIPFIHTRRGGATVHVGSGGVEVSYGTDDSVPGAVETRGLGGGR